MSEPIRTLLSNRTTRREARSLFDNQLAQVKADLAERGIGSRFAAKASEDLSGYAKDAVEIAKDSKGIIAGTVTALALWLFRKPVTNLAQRLLAKRGQSGIQEDPASVADTPQE